MSKWDDVFNAIKNKISKESVLEYYEIENHTIKECLTHFDISNATFIKLLRAYGIHKSKEAHTAQIKKTKLDRYGSESYNNIEKIKETNLANYGVENQFQRTELMRESYQTKLGVDHPMHDDNIKQRSIENHDYTEIRAKANATNLKKYGVENTFESTELMKQSIKTWQASGDYLNDAAVRATCLEKYGVPYPCMRLACKQMSSNNSTPNRNFANKLIENNIDFQQEFALGTYSYDFKINNILVEINPTATHNSIWSPFKGKDGIAKSYHKDKSICAIKAGYRCIHIFDWDNQDAIIQLLSDKEKVMARKCIIKPVIEEEARNFINNYHIQGYAKATISIGLYYNDNLISIMTFGKPRYNKNYEYELVRYCASKNVIGGAKRLFKYFLNNYQPSSIISYCDLSKFSGDTYLKLGFKLKRISAPAKHWYNIKTKQHITDNLLRARGFDQLFNTNFGKGTSNDELMLQAGFVTVYDCGQATYILKL